MNDAKIITVAIIGLGGRGGDVYGSLIKDNKNYKIVALCDKKQTKLDRFSKEFGVDAENCFLNEDEFFKGKRADFLVIATPDKAHISHLKKAMPLGYDILVEKPVCESKKECDSLIKMQKKYGNNVFVCHVLRYAPAFVKLGELLKENRVGKLVAINALERVSFWHHAHSYVRGNWRNTDVAYPMILAKCCHDLDLIYHFVGAKCKSVSSLGDNAYFKSENAPKDCGDRCLDCACEQDCPYSAKKIYLDRWKKNCPVDLWPYNVIADAPLSEDKIIKALKDGPYGRCVFKCDNNVVDHQIVLMDFDNGVKASLTMMAYTKDGGRRYVFYGTEGEMVYDEQGGGITVRRFGEPTEEIDIGGIVKDKGYGHGGGDFMMISAMTDVLTGKKVGETTLEGSIESHLIGDLAEKSRLNGGKKVKVH